MKTKKLFSVALSFALLLGSFAGFPPECAAAAETAKKMVVYVAAEGNGASGSEVKIDKTAVQVAEGDTADVAVKQVLDKYYKDNYQYQDGFLDSIGSLAGSNKAPWVYWGFKVNGAEPQNPDSGMGYGIGDYPLQAHDEISLVYGTMEEMPAQCSSYDNDAGKAPGEERQAEILEDARAQKQFLAQLIYGEIFGGNIVGGKDGPYIPGIEDTDSLYSVFSLVQSGYRKEAFYDNVCRRILSQLREMKNKGKIVDPSSGKEITLSSYEGNKYVVLNYTKIALVLSALGVDITNAEGVNLVEKMTQKDFYEKANATTLTREAMILFAMNTSGTRWPVGENYVSEKDLVNHLLADVENQIAVSTDLTNQWGATLDAAAMVVQALAPYTRKETEGVDRTRVQQACTEVMKLLSHMQDNQTGGFSGANDNLWTLAQCMITVGLLEQDTNPVKDAGFIKNGKTLFDASGKYLKQTDGWPYDEDLLSYQPDQLLRGLTACLRRVEGRSLYDVSSPSYRAKTEYTLFTADNVSPIPKQKYTGRSVYPEVTVTVAGKKLTQYTDYTLRHYENIEVGNAYVIVKGKGDYQGTVKVPFQIYKQELPVVPPDNNKQESPTAASQKISLKKPVIKKLSSPGKKTLAVTFGKVSKAKKYVVQIATDKKFKKNSKKKTVSAVKKVTFKKLRAGRKYYVRVRAYSGKVKSPYSKVKSKKVKKR